MKICNTVLFSVLFAVAFFGMAVSANASTGVSGTSIVELQTYLINEGLLVMPPGVAKGYFGPKTTNALKVWQKRNNLPETGLFDEQTSNRYYAMKKLALSEFDTIMILRNFAPGVGLLTWTTHTQPSATYNVFAKEVGSGTWQEIAKGVKGEEMPSVDDDSWASVPHKMFYRLLLDMEKIGLLPHVAYEFRACSPNCIYSTETYTFTPSVKFTSPKEGETLDAGKSATVRWEKLNKNVDSYKLLITSALNFNCPVCIVSPFIDKNLSGNKKSYKFKVPSDAERIDFQIVAIDKNGEEVGYDMSSIEVE